MNSPSSSRSAKETWVIAISALLSLIYVFINLANVGGGEFLFNFNGIVTIPLAVAVSLYALSLRKQVIEFERSRLLWTGMTIGWILWTVAEIWWLVAGLLGQEVPYPSWADFFWLVGYIPMYAGLSARIRSLPDKPRPVNRAWNWGIAILATLLTAVYVFWPILQSYDPSLLLESILNLLYPFVDLVLLLFILRIFFTFQQGVFGRVWVWISVGFILHMISNLVFSYATIYELYYPDFQWNLISVLFIDIPYNLSYLFWLIGLFIFGNVGIAQFPPTKGKIVLEPVPNTHVLVFTKGDDKVIDTSHNHAKIFAAQDIEGKGLAEVLGLQEDECARICAEARSKPSLKERPVTFACRFGTREGFLSGITIANPDGGYAGATYLLRAVLPESSLDELLSEHQKSTIEMIKSKTNSRAEDEIKQLLTAYHVEYFKGFYNEIIREGGAVAIDSFLTKLQSTAVERQWKVSFQPDTLLDTSRLSLSEMRQVYPAILDVIKQYVGALIDEERINQTIRRIDAEFDESIHQSVMVHMKNAKKGL